MSISVTQLLAASGLTSPATSHTTPAFGSSVTTGSTLIAFVWSYGLATSAGIDDSTGSNTAKWTQDALKLSSDNLLQCAIWRASNVTGGASFTLTATLNASTYVSVCAMEVAGLTNSSPLDGAGSTNSGSGAGQTTGAFSTSNANDLLVATFGSTAVSAVSARPTSFTQVGSFADGGTHIDGDASYRIVSATQSSLNPSWTTTGSGNWASAALAYQAAAAAGNRRRRVLITAGGG